MNHHYFEHFLMKSKNILMADLILYLRVFDSIYQVLIFYDFFQEIVAIGNYRNVVRMVVAQNINFCV